MLAKFRQYHPRFIKFFELYKVDDWQVKCYTISAEEKFKNPAILTLAQNKLGDWLEAAVELNLPTYRTAFLIIHEGSDGIWTLINWWIGGEMLQTKTFFTSFSDINLFKPWPKEGSMACVWEMAVINHERGVWIKNVLQQAENPDLEGYLSATLEDQI